MLLLGVLLSALTAPVPGEVVRAFDYGPDPFARGQHRGVDLAAAPGDPVRAACGGRVVVAGEVAGRIVVSLDCGPYRVSQLPLRRVTVRPGDRLRRGRAIGTAASGRHGLHLGVRRRGDPFGYVDPEHLLRTEPPPSMPVLPAPQRARERHRRWPGAPRPAPRAPVPATVPAADAPSAAHAPWPVYAGLALLTAGALGAGARARSRGARVGHSEAWTHASASSRSG